jgi:hypothetical protein
MADEPTSIVFPAVVYKVQTLVDNGIRVTLDLPETAILSASQLMACQAKGITLQAELTPVEESSQDGSTRPVSRTKTKRRV